MKNNFIKIRNLALLLIIAVIGLYFIFSLSEPETTGGNGMATANVTIFELAETVISEERLLTGAVSLYREEKIGFEVSGRLLSVIDTGLEVKGPAFDEKGRMVRRGEPIAEIENTRYTARVKSLRALLQGAEEELTAALAERKLADQNLTRQKNVFLSGAGSQQAVDIAQSTYDQANARVVARTASVDAATERLVLAEEDLEDTVLYAPFNGRITMSHTTRGAVINAGAPIVTLTLMDPLFVRVEVSADDERRIRTGHSATVYVEDFASPGERLPITGIVYEKSAVADDRLRTFQIDLIIRNKRHHIHDILPDLAGLPVTNEYIPVIREFQNEPGPMFVHVDSIFEEEGENFVLRLPKISLATSNTESAFGKHIPEKIKVKLGDEYTTVISWNFRSLMNAGVLKEGDFLIVNPMPEFLDGVVVGRPQWMLRPGDIVPVMFNLGNSPQGFYIPSRAILGTENAPNILVVEDGKAVRKNVTVLDAKGDLSRIEGADITTGQKLIVDGVHFVSVGQPVHIKAAPGSS